MRVENRSLQMLTQWYKGREGQKLRELIYDRLKKEIVFPKDTALYLGPLFFENKIANVISVKSTKTILGDRLGDRCEINTVCNFDRLPFEDSSFEYVILPHTLEFFEDTYGILSEAYRVLKEEGKLVVIGFNPLSIWTLKEKFISNQKMNSPPIGNLMYLFKLEKIMNHIGLEHILSTSICNRPISSLNKKSFLLDFIEILGDFFWPVGGCIYFCIATKRAYTLFYRETSKYFRSKYYLKKLMQIPG